MPERETIHFGKWDLGPVSLEPTPDQTIEVEDFSTLVSYLRHVKEAEPWWTGDGLNYGEQNFGEAAAKVLHVEAQEATDWSPTTLRVCQWVCEKVTVDTRRADLSFAHHRKVAALDTRSQRTWLARAAEGDGGVPWTVRRLNAELHNEASGGPAAVFYVLVQCKSPRDQEKFLERMLGEGRIAKSVTKGRGEAWLEQRQRGRARKTAGRRARARTQASHSRRARPARARRTRATKRTRKRARGSASR